MFQPMRYARIHIQYSKSELLLATVPSYEFTFLDDTECSAERRVSVQTSETRAEARNLILIDFNIELAPDRTNLALDDRLRCE
jgi:hypothetical protein